MQVNKRNKIAVDIMSGDNPPHILIDGALQAASENDLEIILVGNRNLIKQELMKYKNLDLSKVSICHSDEVIEMHESPAKACKLKPNASVMVAADLVAKDLADAYISPGNSGATMTASLLKLRRIKGIKRPAIAATMPTLTGYTVVIDAGANVDTKPEHLVQFGYMGSIYMKKMFKSFQNISPRVGLLTIGEEELKGNDLTLRASDLLKQSKLNFIGNVEGKDINTGKCDVVVCDGFVGNIVLKVTEGVASVVIKLLKKSIKKSLFRRLAALLLLPVFAELKLKLDAKEYGGALLLGTNGITVICHGNSDEIATKNAIKFADFCVKNNLNQEIKNAMSDMSFDGEDE